MPEEAVQTQAEQAPAESSPAIEIPKDPEAYAEWRINAGRTPDDAKAEGKPKREGSAPSTSESSASEAEKKPQQHRKNADDRINEWTGDIKALGLKPSDLKLSREELLERLSPPRPKAIPDRTEQPAAAPAQTELKPPVKPEFKNYNGDWDAFDAARDKYFEDLADYKVAVAVQADRIQRAHDANTAIWRQKLAEAKTRYGAEADTAIVKTARQISGDEKIHPAVKALLDDSPVLADLLYVMGSEADDFDSFLTEARERPGLAIRRAVLLEQLVYDELAKGAKPGERTRGENGQFQAAEKPPAKKTTAAPAPPAEVSGRGSPPEDESVRATRDGDFRSFRAIENRKALARLKSQ